MVPQMCQACKGHEQNHWVFVHCFLVLNLCYYLQEQAVNRGRLDLVSQDVVPCLSFEGAERSVSGCITVT